MREVPTPGDIVVFTSHGRRHVAVVKRISHTSSSRPRIHMKTFGAEHTQGWFIEDGEELRIFGKDQVKFAEEYPEYVL